MFLSKDGTHVIKASKGKSSAKKFAPDIDNIPLYNYLFPETAYEILGYGEINGKFVRILKQPFVDFDKADRLTADERTDYMDKLGFQPINEDRTVFSNHNLVVADLQKSNIVFDKDRHVNVIDADVKLHTKDVGGEYTYPPVEEDVPDGTVLPFAKGKNGDTAPARFPAERTANAKRAAGLSDAIGSPKAEVTDKIGPYATEGTVLFSTKGKKGDEKNLVGLHNISAEKLGKALRMGGLANPSAAVIDLSHQDHFHYGEITLVMPSSLVDSRTGDNIGTFDRDAWTPLYPNIIYNSTKETDKRLKALTADLPEELGRHIRYAVGQYMDGNVYNSGLEYIFLKEKGEEIGVQTKPRRYPYLTLGRIWQMLGVPEDTNTNDHEVWFTAYEALPKEQQKAFNAMFYTEGDPTKGDAKEKRGEKDEKYRAFWDKFLSEPIGFGPLDNFIYRVMRDERDAGAEDYSLTFERAVRAVKDRGYADEFSQWQTGVINNLGYEERIFVGRTPSGNRKTIPHTLENVSKYMKQQGRNASKDHGATGLGMLKARLSQKFKTLQQIRSHKDQLVNYGDERLEKIGDRIREAVFTFYDSKLSASAGMYTAELVAQEYAEDILVRGQDVDRVIERYNDSESTPIELSEEEKNELRQLRKDLVNIPAFYFETKFERPVYLNEFAAAVLPKSTPAGIRAALEEQGLPVYEYEEDSAESRSNAVRKASEADGIRFSVIGKRGAERLDNADAPWRIAALDIARNMEKESKDAKTIRMATGWERGADDKWRFEIPDYSKVDVSGNMDFEKEYPEFARYKELIRMQNANFWEPEKNAPLSESEQEELEMLSAEFPTVPGKRIRYHESSKLKDYIDNDELFAAYPKFRDIDVRFEPMDDNVGGYSDHANNAIVLDDALWTQRGKFASALIHEIQHFIQEEEGFAEGSNLEQATRQALAAAKEQGRDFVTRQEALGVYARSAGEVEARNVEKRNVMSFDERRNTLLADTEDVARKDQIVMFSAAELLNIDDLDEFRDEVRFSSVGRQIKPLEDNKTLAERAAIIKALPAEIEVEGPTKTQKELKKEYASNQPLDKDGKLIRFYLGGFTKSWHQPLFRAVVGKIREILDGAVLAYTEHQDKSIVGKKRKNGSVHTNRRNVNEYRNYVNKVTLDGEEYYVRFMVFWATGDATSTHYTRVSNVSLYKENQPSVRRPHLTSGLGSPRIDNDTNLQQFFDLASNSEENGVLRDSAIYDEDGNAVNFSHEGGLPTGFERQSLVERTYRKTVVICFQNL